MSPYELRWSCTARRAIAHGLPEQVAAAAVEFITGPLASNPRRVGKALRAELTGIHTGRLGQSWRVLYEIDEASHTVTVLDIQHRAISYRRRSFAEPPRTRIQQRVQDVLDEPRSDR